MPLELKPWQWALLLVLLGICVLLLIGGFNLLPRSDRLASEEQTSTPKPRLTLTLSATPSLTTTPTETVMRTPMATFTSIPSPAPTLPVTVLPTLSPMPDATPVPSQTPSPTPLPHSSSRLSDALRLQTNGDHKSAITAYLSILEHDPTAAETRRAQFHLAESYLLDRDYPDAASVWESFLSSYPEDLLAPQAALMAARAYQADNRCEKATLLLQLHVSPETVLADLAYEWIGDCYSGKQSFEEALAAYRHAANLSLIPDVGARIGEKLAGIYLAGNEYDAALAEYVTILRLDSSDEDRARIEYMAGQVLAAMGRPADAYEYYQRAVERSPESGFAYLSLLELEAAGQEVDEFQAGLGYYHAGQANPDAYGTAIRTFDRYLAQEKVPKADEALFHKALAQQAAGHTSGALASLERIIAGHPGSPWLERAWLEKVEMLARTGSVSQAVKTSMQMADLFPASDLAAQALWQVADLRDKVGAVAQAAELYKDLQARFPGYEHAAEALWRAGFIDYLALAPGQAAVTWQHLADTYPGSEFSARALYWLGKLDSEGPSQPGSKHWDQLLDEYPFDYFAIRAAQVRSEVPPTSVRFVTEPVGAYPWDVNEAEDQLLSWLSEWTEVPADTETSLVELTTTPGQQVRLDRVGALLEIGLRKEAIAESEIVISSAWNDPRALGRLALFFYDQDLHMLAARSAVRLAALWPEGRLIDAPPVLGRLAYPLAYTDLLSAESQKRNLDPLLLASLIRQESLFEPSAESSAGARGLSQVMPATGSQLARFLGMDDYTEDDLYRPSVSIELGAYYLATLLQVFDDQIPVTLASYNGGPGNAQRWLDAASGDLDLFVEMITAEESQRFLRRIYEGYVIYETLYRGTEPAE